MNRVQDFGPDERCLRVYASRTQSLDIGSGWSFEGGTSRMDLGFLGYPFCVRDRIRVFRSGEPSGRSYVLRTCWLGRDVCLAYLLFHITNYTIWWLTYPNNYVLNFE